MSSERQITQHSREPVDRAPKRDQGMVEDQRRVKVEQRGWGRKGRREIWIVVVRWKVAHKESGDDYKQERNIQGSWTAVQLI